MTEKLINIITKIKVKEKRYLDDPSIRFIEREITQAFLEAQCCNENCPTTKKFQAQIIYNKICKLAEYGVNIKAVEYAIKFDNSFRLKDIVPNSS